MSTVLALNHDQMGHGDAELGRRILATFLRKVGALSELTAIVFYNTGVRLVAEGSPVLPELHALYEAGVDLRPCGTCLEHFALRDKVRVGNVSNMDEIVAELNRAGKVITL